MRDCILVTGGAGFIGSALSKLICASDLPVVTVDSFLEQVHPSGERSEFMDDRVILLKRDVRDANTWADLLAEYRPVKIVHLAAETGTAQSLTEATRVDGAHVKNFAGQERREGRVHQTAMRKVAMLKTYSSFRRVAVARNSTV